MTNKKPLGEPRAVRSDRGKPRNTTCKEGHAYTVATTGYKNFTHPNGNTYPRAYCKICNRNRARIRAGLPLDAPTGLLPRKPKQARPFKCGHPRDELHLGWTIRGPAQGVRAYCKPCVNNRNRARRGLPAFTDVEWAMASTERDLRQTLAGMRQPEWVETRKLLKAKVWAQRA